MKTNSGNIISLDIGGKLFKTTISTIKRVEKWLIADMINNCEISEIIFIDRDPKWFRYILNYLRMGKIDLNDVNLNELYMEADYYGLDCIIKLIKEYPKDVKGEDKCKDSKMKMINERLDYYYNGRDVIFILLVYKYFDLIQNNNEIINKYNLHNFMYGCKKEVPNIIVERELNPRNGSTCEYLYIHNFKDIRFNLKIKMFEKKLYPFDIEV